MMFYLFYDHKYKAYIIIYLAISIVVNEMLTSQNEPALFIVNRCEVTFFVLRTLHHKTLSHDVIFLGLEFFVLPCHPSQ